MDPFTYCHVLLAFAIAWLKSLGAAFGKNGLPIIKNTDVNGGDWWNGNNEKYHIDDEYGVFCRRQRQQNRRHTTFFQ